MRWSTFLYFLRNDIGEKSNDIKQAANNKIFETSINSYEFADRKITARQTEALQVKNEWPLQLTQDAVG